MSTLRFLLLCIATALPLLAGVASAQPVATTGGGAAGSPATAPFVLGPPPGDGPVVVRADFQLQDINAIDDESETFEFSGVLTLRWHDPRCAFDPAEAGVKEKVFQGAFQFDEISPGWYPQVVLVNVAGMYEKSGTILRVQPDGGCTLVETVNAVAKTWLNLRRFPFDAQRLEAVFEVLGHDTGEVVFAADGALSGPSTAEASADRRPANAAHAAATDMRLPQWRFEGIHCSTGERTAPYAGARGVSSTFTVRAAVARDPFYMGRLVMMPLSLIVLLSFSVFWMDRSSLGDRINVSFIGILTGVAYQIVMSDILPRISYMTLIHGFLNFSFLTMCATVVINLVVGRLDARGQRERGDQLDRRCRWIFPLAYFGLVNFVFGVAFLAF